MGRELSKNRATKYGVGRKLIVAPKNGQKKKENY
jgi:hypothetical protein